MSKITFDGLNKLIIVNTGVTSIDIAVDLYSEWKKWVLDNPQWDSAFRVVGGDIIGVNQYIPSYFFLINNWQVKVDNLSVNFSTNLYSDNFINPFIINNSSVMVKNSDVPGISNLTAITNDINTITVDINSINQNITAITYGIDNIEVQQSAITYDINSITLYQSAITSDIYIINENISAITYDIDNIISPLSAITNDLSAITNNLSAITNDLNDVVLTLTGLTGSIDDIAKNVLSILGLSQHNYRLKNHVYDVNNKLTSCNIKLYYNSGDCNNDVNVFEIYQMNATYDATGNLTDYKVIKL